MHFDKRVFIGLCLALWFVNGWMWNGSSGLSGVWLGFGVSLMSIPVWVLVGSAFSSAGIFFFRLARVDTARRLSLWQKADVGLALAVVLKPALGIPFEEGSRGSSRLLVSAERRPGRHVISGLRTGFRWNAPEKNRDDRKCEDTRHR